VSPRSHAIRRGVVGTAMTAAALVTLAFTDWPQHGARTAALLGVALVVGSTLLERAFIQKVFWRWQPYDGKSTSSIAGLPFGKNHQIGLLGLAMIGCATLTYNLVDLPPNNSLVPTVLGIQAAGGVLMAIRGFLVHDVVYPAALDIEMVAYLVMNLALCIAALAVAGRGLAWWQLSILLHLFWVAVGFTHHLRPLRERIRHPAMPAHPQTS